MKIAVWHNTGPGGARRYLYDHIQGLLQRGHSVQSWCLSTATQEFLPLNKLVSERVVPVETNRNPSRLAPLRAFQLWKEADTLLGAVAAACRICADEINRGSFDLLLVTNCVLTVVPPVAGYVRIPGVMYLQEPRRKFYEAFPDLPWMVKGMRRMKDGREVRLTARMREMIELHNMRLLATAEKKHAAGYNQLLVNSLFSRESILRAYGLDAKVCYMGVDTDYFKPSSAIRRPCVLGVGEFSVHKNIPFVIDSIAAIDESSRPLLVWAANGGSRAAMCAWRQYAESKGVRFDPRFGISDAELLDLYQTAAVAVYAPRLEPCGLVPLEANACGLPVVAVAEGGVREIIKDGTNGFLVEQEPKAVAEAVTRLLTHSDMARDIGVEARKWVTEHWSLQQSVRRLESRLDAIRNLSCA